MKPSYLALLDALVGHCLSMPNTPMSAQVRVAALVALNLRYEKVQVERSLATHPYILVEGFVKDAIVSVQSFRDVLSFESDNLEFSSDRPEAMEDMHQDLFQRLWTQYDIDLYKSDRIARYERRIDINDIAPLIAGKDCIDFGCGHGSFSHALVNRGARRVLGIDFGAESLDHAAKMRDILGVSADRVAFKLATVYDTGEPAASYDFAIQNGVFHHLDDEDRAYAEVHRVLKPGGWLWVYTDGTGAITHHLWDASRAALANVPPPFIIEQLKRLNLATGKVYHCGDGFNAVYRHTTWEDLTGRLERLGFGEFRRIQGGFPTDFDDTVIADDRYGNEKFGTGDLRLVCRKVG